MRGRGDREGREVERGKERMGESEGERGRGIQNVGDRGVDVGEKGR
jgi:hypothetical protein